jgi:hypothetical protein
MRSLPEGLLFFKNDLQLSFRVQCIKVCLPELMILSKLRNPGASAFAALLLLFTLHAEAWAVRACAHHGHEGSPHGTASLDVSLGSGHSHEGHHLSGDHPPPHAHSSEDTDTSHPEPHCDCGFLCAAGAGPATLNLDEWTSSLASPFPLAPRVLGRLLFEGSSPLHPLRNPHALPLSLAPPTPS